MKLQITALFYCVNLERIETKYSICCSKLIIESIIMEVYGIISYLIINFSVNINHFINKFDNRFCIH